MIDGDKKSLKIQFRYICVIVLISLIGSGCQVEARYAYSAPRLDGDYTSKVRNGTFHFEDIDLWLLTWNRKGSGLMILPIPIPLDVRDEVERPFRITVQLEPHRSGFSFSTAKNILSFSKSRVKRFTPTRIQGGSKIKGRTLISRLPPSDNQIFELEKGVKTIVDLAFDTTPPDPDEIFFLDIEGLLLEGKLYSVPRIRFEKELFSGTMR